MSFDTQKTKLLEVCKKLLSDKKVDTVLGYVKGEVDDLAIPFFAKDAAEVDSLEWSEFCSRNLAVYLRGRSDKVAIVAKPCDVRAIISYVVENQVNRDDVYIIGMDCAGVKAADGSVAAGCAECRVQIPPISDERIENPDVKENKEVRAAGEKIANTIERFQGELQKCIMCFACRQACYGCYCDTCFMDRGVPNWQPTKPDMGAKMVYHLGRAMHLSGRCVECGSCERACPSGVNVRYMIKDVTDFVEKLYGGYRAGMDIDATPVMQNYDFNDREVGFLGGETLE